MCLSLESIAASARINVPKIKVILGEIQLADKNTGKEEKGPSFSRERKRANLDGGGGGGGGGVNALSSPPLKNRRKGGKEGKRKVGLFFGTPARRHILFPHYFFQKKGEKIEKKKGAPDRDWFWQLLVGGGVGKCVLRPWVRGVGGGGGGFKLG